MALAPARLLHQRGVHALWQRARRSEVAPEYKPQFCDACLDRLRARSPHVQWRAHPLACARLPPLLPPVSHALQRALPPRRLAAEPPARRARVGRSPPREDVSMGTTLVLADRPARRQRRTVGARSRHGRGRGAAPRTKPDHGSPRARCRTMTTHPVAPRAVHATVPHLPGVRAPPAHPSRASSTCCAGGRGRRCYARINDFEYLTWVDALRASTASVRRTSGARRRRPRGPAVAPRRRRAASAPSRPIGSPSCRTTTPSPASSAPSAPTATARVAQQSDADDQSPQ